MEIGFLSSGDGYSRSFDAILSDFELKERCVDSTIQYETELQTHSLRTIDFLIRVGQAGIVLNADKFYFARRIIIVDFAKFLENCVQLIFSLKRLHVEKITLIEILLTKRTAMGYETETPAVIVLGSVTYK